MTRKLALVVLALLASKMAVAGEITGTVSYREKIALPAGAVVTVRLEDVSVADAPSKLVSELRFATGGKQVPFAFRLPYVDSAIQKGARYHVRASIHSGGQLLFTTSEARLVITNAVKKVSLVLNRIVAMNSPPLQGATWTLTELGGKPSILGRTGSPTIKLSSEKSEFGAYTGVNSLGGTFKITGTSIKFDPGPQ
ncbi:MAG: YbaY family lipoprotein, partial [Chlorobia bacterium]|nr:YbaY family lipoprotein [Fimbriimonadaceae bacterium]